MQTGPLIMCAGGMLQHDKQATSHCPWAARYSAFRTPHSALRIRSQNRPPPGDFTLGVPGWSAVDRTIRECGMRSAECGMLFADRGDWARQTGPPIMCAGGMLQHDKQATSHCPWAARYSAFRIPHSALRIRSQNRPPPGGFTLGVPGWSAVDRTIRECGMRSAECGMLFADRGDWARQTGPPIMCAGGMLQHDKQATLHCPFAARYSAFRIPHSALRIRSQNRAATSRLHAGSTRMVGRGSND